MKRQLMILSLFVIFLSATLMPAAAQESWFAYLYNPVDKSLLRVSLDGTQETFSLGLDETTWVGTWDMAFANTQPRVAFCTVTYAENSPAGSIRLIVRDIEGQTNVLEQDLGAGIGCRASLFSDNDTVLAVGVVRRYEGDAAADQTAPLWELLLVDTATGATLHTLDANNPAFAAEGAMVGISMLPDVRWLGDDSLIFAGIPWGVGGFGPTPAYRWTHSTDALAPVERWGEIAYDTLGGALIWVTYLPEYPAANPGGPMASVNAVKYSDKSGEESIIYYTSEWVVLDAKFIENGDRVAIQLLSSFDMNNPEAVQEVKWIALDRQGNQTDLDTNVSYAQLESAPEGYVYLEMTNPNDDPNQQQFTLDLVQGGNATRLWEFTGENFGATWELAYVAPTVSGESMGFPFPGVDMSGVPMQTNEG